MSRMRVISLGGCLFVPEGSLAEHHWRNCSILLKPFASLGSGGQPLQKPVGVKGSK